MRNNFLLSMASGAIFAQTEVTGMLLETGMLLVTGIFSSMMN
jgi:hypothetical protein